MTTLLVEYYTKKKGRRSNEKSYQGQKFMGGHLITTKEGITVVSTMDLCNLLVIISRQGPTRVTEHGY